MIFVIFSNIYYSLKFAQAATHDPTPPLSSLTPLPDAFLFYSHWTSLSLTSNRQSRRCELPRMPTDPIAEARLSSRGRSLFCQYLEIRFKPPIQVYFFSNCICSSLPFMLTGNFHGFFLTIVFVQLCPLGLIINVNLILLISQISC
jgi:hypothetical protein